MEPQSIFDLTPQEFEGAIGELSLPQSEADQLRRQYRRQNSMFAGLYGLLDRVRGQDAEQGRVRADMLPMTRPEGMTGIEALLSGNAELAVPGGLLGSAEAAAMGIDAPAAAYQGMIPAEDMAGEALGTAGMAMTGGLLPNAGRLMEFDPATVSIFAGRNARTADLSALRRAERMQARGATGEEIWQETGWFQGADGQWRFEINDAGAQMRPAASQFAGDYIPLRDAFSHLEMQRAYPTMFVSPDGQHGISYRYNEGSPAGEYRAPYRSTGGTIEIRAPQEGSMAQGRSLTLHELQHAVQNVEGFIGGSNRRAQYPLPYRSFVANERSADNFLDALISGDEAEIARLRAISPRGFPVWENVQPYFPGQSAEEILGQIRPNARGYAHGLYERIPGEVEARLVQARGELSPAQRISEYPLNTPVPYEISDYRLQELTDYLAQYGLLNQ